jgi:hypothetical protein
MIEIYAELSKKQYNLIQMGGASIEVPRGVNMKNKAGSRALFFSCDDAEVAKELIEGLNESAIAWQENS